MCVREGVSMGVRVYEGKGVYVWVGVMGWGI